MGKTNLTPLQRAAMQHNSLIGLSVAIQKNADTITNAATLTAEARLCAIRVRYEANRLEQALRAGRKS